MELRMASMAARILCMGVICVCAALCFAQNPNTKGSDVKAEPLPNTPAVGVRTTDAEGEPLPAGVLARLGSIRWRHGSGIIRSALSADGKRLATISKSSVAVWDMTTGKVLFRFPTFSRKERSERIGYYTGPQIIAFSPDGKKLGYAFNGAFTGVWHLENGCTFRRFGDKETWQSHDICRFTPDSKQFILIYEDCIRFWDVATGKLQRLMPAEFAVIAISADVSSYAQIDHKRELALRIRDLQSGATIIDFKVGAGDGEAVFAPDGKSVALVHEKKKEIQIWELPAAKMRTTFPLPKLLFADELIVNVHCPYCVGFSADSKLLMMGTGDGMIHRWDLTRNKALPVLGKKPADTRELDELSNAVALHELPDHKILVATGADGLIRRWDTARNREVSDLGNYQGSPRAVFSPDGRLAAVGDSRGRVDLWDMREVKLLRTLRKEGPRLTALAFTPDGKTLAVGLMTAAVFIYDVASGREVKSILFDEIEKELKSDFVMLPMLVSPDARFLCLESSGGDLLMWDLAQARVRWRTESEFFFPKVNAAFSPDGKTLAVASWKTKTSITLLDAMTGKERRSITLALDSTKGFDSLQAIAFAPDGRQLAVALGDKTISLIDAATETESMRLPASSDPLAFSPDGRLLATEGVETVTIWDTITGKKVLCLDGHTDFVNTLAFGAGGYTLLSCGNDSQVYLWTLRPKIPAGEKRSLESLWLELGSSDAAAAYRAVWDLSEHTSAVAFLGTKIAPSQAIDQKKVAMLLAELDDSSFETRQAATLALAEMGDRVQGAMEKALQKTPSQEVSARLRRLLDALRRQPTGLRLQQFRAVQAMELAATPAARRLIQQWADAADGAAFTESAHAALRRLDKQLHPD
jgi:WD40 repeat protein